MDTMKRPSAQYIKDGLAALAKAFPPTPPRYAEFTIKEVEAIAVVVMMTPERRDSLRGLFPEMNDSEIVNELIDALFDRFGVLD